MQIRGPKPHLGEKGGRRVSAMVLFDKHVVGSCGKTENWNRYRDILKNRNRNRYRLLKKPTKKTKTDTDFKNRYRPSSSWGGARISLSRGSVLSREYFPSSLRCVVGTSTTQQFHFVVLPRNPEHNSFKLLCCGFSGRWHLWATI